MKHTYFLIAIAIMILPISAMAFSDNFNDCDGTDWTMSAGVFSAVNTLPNFDGTCYARFAVAGADITATKTNDAGNFVSFDFMISSYAGSFLGTSYTLYYQCSVNCAAYKAFQISSTGTFIEVSSGVVSYTPYALTVGYKYHVESTYASSNRRTVISNYTTGVVLDDQTELAATEQSHTYIRLSAHSTANAIVYSIDNLLTADAPIVTTPTHIAWQSTAYTVGDSPSFSWTITDADWNGHPLQIYIVRLYKSGIMQDWGTFNWACLCSSQLAVAQTGSYVVYADVPGTYLVTLELMTPLIGGNTIVYQSNTSVHAQSSSYFTIPSSAFIKTNTTATYHIGIGGVTGAIDWYYLNNGVEVREAGKILSGTDGSINITFAQVGTYNVYLKSITGTAQTFQSHTVTTSFIQGTPENNFANNSIALIPVGTYGGNGGTYHMNDVLYGNYSIANTTFAANGVFFIDIYNIDASAETTQFFGQGITTVGLTDFGTFALVISNNANDVFKTNWLPGNNSVRLMVQYSNGTFGTLATANFFLSRLTIDGYGLDVVPLEVKTNTRVTATVTSPTANNASLEITSNNGYFKTYPLGAGTVVIFSSFSREGIYGYNLYGSDGKVKTSQQVTVSNAITNNTNPAIPPISTTGTDISGLLQSKIFWTLVFIVGIMLSISMKERLP